MADYTYVCPNAGHEGKREFIMADPGWFADHGLSTPVNCPACRAWIRGLEDEVWHCAVCKKRRVFTATYKEAFHRSQGRFELPEVCGEACAKKLEKRRLVEQQRVLKERALQELMQTVEDRQVLATTLGLIGAELKPELQDEVLEPVTSYDGMKLKLKYVTDRLADGRWSG